MYKGSAYHVPASYILYAITTRARANHLHHRNRTPSSRHWQRNSILSKSMNRDRIRGLKNKSFCTDYLSISRPISIIEGNLSSNRSREIKLNCEIHSKFQVEGKKKQIQEKRFQFIIARIGKVVSKSFQNPSNHGLRGLSLTIPPVPCDGCVRDPFSDGGKNDENVVTRCYPTVSYPTLYGLGEFLRS